MPGPLRSGFLLRGAIIVALAAILLPVAPKPADAAVATASIAVSATILDACTLTVTPLPFGNYAGAALAGTTSATVNCTLGGLATLSSNVGVNGSGAFQRNMISTVNATTLLPYNIYTTVGHTVIFGDGSGTTVTFPVIGTGLPVTTTLYGNIPASAVVFPGGYSDSVLVTLTY